MSIILSNDIPAVRTAQRTFRTLTWPLSGLQDEKVSHNPPHKLSASSPYTHQSNDIRSVQGCRALAIWLERNGSKKEEKEGKMTKLQWKWLKKKTTDWTRVRFHNLDNDNWQVKKLIFVAWRWWVEGAWEREKEKRKCRRKKDMRPPTTFCYVVVINHILCAYIYYSHKQSMLFTFYIYIFRRRWREQHDEDSCTLSGKEGGDSCECEPGVWVGGYESRKRASGGTMDDNKRR